MKPVKLIFLERLKKYCGRGVGKGWEVLSELGGWRAGVYFCARGRARSGGWVNWRLESRQNPQAGKPALHGGGENMESPHPNPLPSDGRGEAYDAFYCLNADKTSDGVAQKSWWVGSPHPGPLPTMGEGETLPASFKIRACWVKRVGIIEFGKGYSIFLNGLILLFCLLLAGAGCSQKDNDDKPAATASTNAQDKVGVTMDAETQERIGLKTEMAASAQWQPQIQAVGTVVDPLTFIAAVSDLASVRASADASGHEASRTKQLADQNNMSVRALETAQAAATHDALALAAAKATFTAAWGANLAGRTDLADFAQQLATNDTSLVKLSLPSGTILQPAPARATIYALDGETNPIAATLVDDLGTDPASQTQTLLFSTVTRMPRGAAVTGALAIAGQTAGGTVVPFSAVLRYEGLGWVYLQAGTNQFVRMEVPLDRLLENGWFVPGNQPLTNPVVVTGAQTILSTELGVAAGADSD